MAEYDWGYGAEYEPEYWAESSPAYDPSAGGWGYDPSTMAFSQNPLYEGGTTSGGGWGYDPATGQFSQAPLTGEDYTTGGGGNWWDTVLGGLGQVGSFLGKNAGLIGPLAGAAGSIAGGAIGSNAAQDASRLQADALNRGIDLQTAQWLQQQQNLAPYLQAGQQGLSQLQQLAGREQPGLPGATPGVSGANYQLPSTTPGWTPQTYYGPHPVTAEGFRWNPQQGPQAQDYRYTPGQTPDAAQYASGPPQLYQGAMPGTQVSTLTGQQVLDQDPGAAFRQSEARKALEASAAARGGLLSGSTLGALQRQSQDLASQEYGNAYQRMMQRDVEQYGRNWGQYQQNWNQGVTGAELGMRTQAQNFAQAEAASRLREQVNQVASQQGWTQAQAESVFREQMGQLASQQGFNQALGAQGQNFTQGLQAQQWQQQQAQQWGQEQNRNMLEQAKLRYGMDVTQNTTDYDRQQALYKQQLGQHLLPWEQQSTLATLGGQAVGQYGQQGQSATNAISNLLGQQGTAQAGGAMNQANSWLNALQNVGGAVQGGLQNNALLSALSNLNR